MKLAIITGASKGLGAALAFNLLEKNIGIVSISRTKNEELENFAKETSTFFQHYPCDLSQRDDTLQTMNKVISEIQQLNPDTLYLVNNAAMVGPVEKVGNISPIELEKSLHVNILAPMLIVNLLLPTFALTSTELIVVNVSSGAAYRPISGWSVYGPTKAALNLFTETASLEQEGVKNPATFIAFNPGIMDTDMQLEIRSSHKDSFKDVAKFQEYKEKNVLRTPTLVADKLASLLDEGKLETGKTYAINELL
ncbi:(S)-benzoin forming benzil reductase [Bacillus sp. 2205SS5-2]|uniref:(S)-benzoin forming benzil reductase n=1 Tax=Bacillus sp. 2205SS5-2 TaxID=3109031 RepID=UPI003004F254